MNLQVLNHSLNSSLDLNKKTSNSNSSKRIYEEMIEMEELHQKMMKELLEKTKKKE